MRTQSRIAVIAPDAARAVCCSRSRRRSARRSSQPAGRKFTSEHTQLVVETVTRQGQERQADRRSDGEGLHRHRRRRAADDQLLRVPEAAEMPSSPPRRRGAAPRLPRPLPTAAAVRRRPRSRRKRPGDIRYRDRRLLVLYFDMTRHAACPISCAR